MQRFLTALTLVGVALTALAANFPSIYVNGTARVTGKMTNDNLTASRALVSGADKAFGASATSATELGYVAGVTSAIQTQLDAKVATTTPQTVAYSSSITVNFTTQPDIWTVLAGDLTISSSTLAAGKTVLYRIDNGAATNCNVILPSTWRKISGTTTNILSSGAIGLLYARSYAANDTNVVCQWSSE